MFRFSQPAHVAYFAVARQGTYDIDIVACVERPIVRADREGLRDGSRVLYGPCPTYAEAEEYILDLDPTWTLADDEDD